MAQSVTDPPTVVSMRVSAAARGGELPRARRLQVRRRKWITGAALLIGGAAAVAWGGFTRQSRTMPTAAAPNAVSAAPMVSAQPITTSSQPSAPAAPLAASSAAETERGPQTIEVHATPPAALVVERGRPARRAPVKIKLEPGKSLRLLVTAYGYRPQRITIDGSKPTVSIDLIPYPKPSTQRPNTAVDGPVPSDPEASRSVSEGEKVEPPSGGTAADIDAGRQ